MPDDSKGIHPFLYQAAEKVGFVIPNQRRLRVRDLLFARKHKEKADSSPVQKPNGVRNDIFLTFFRRLLLRESERVGSRACLIDGAVRFGANKFESLARVNTLCIF